MDVVVPGRLAEPLELEQWVGRHHILRRHHPSSRAARSTTCSAVKPSSVEHA